MFNPRYFMYGCFIGLMIAGAMSFNKRRIGHTYIETQNSYSNTNNRTPVISEGKSSTNKNPSWFDKLLESITLNLLIRLSLSVAILYVFLSMKLKGKDVGNDLAGLAGAVVGYWLPM